MLRSAALKCIKLFGVFVFIFFYQVVPVAAQADVFQTLEAPMYEANNCSTTSSSTTPGNANGKVYLVGDSILVRSYFDVGSLKTDLQNAGWQATVDASGGRGMTYPGSDPHSDPANPPLPGLNDSGIDAVKADTDAIKASNTVVVELGTNYGLPISDFNGQVSQVIQTINSDNPSAQIFWVNVMSTGNQGPAPGYSAAAIAYNQTLSQLSSTLNFTVIDARSQNIPLDPADNIHPTIPTGTDQYSKYITDQIGSPQGSSGSSGGTTTGQLNYINVGNIPAAGEDVGASIFGGTYLNGAFTPTNDVQGGPQPHDDNGAGNGGGSPAGHAAYAELMNGTAMGNLPEHTKLAITYNGKTVVAEKLDVGGGGGPVNGKPRVIDLWWETAKLLDFTNGTDVVNIRAVDPSTPTTPVSGQASTAPAGGATNNSNCCPSGSSGSGTVSGSISPQVGYGMSPAVQQKFQQIMVAAGSHKNAQGQQINVNPNFVATFYYIEDGLAGGDSTNNADSASPPPRTGDGKWLEPPPPYGNGPAYPPPNQYGAAGPFQFIPTSWSQYGQDGNGDGKIDVDDLSDAAYAAANLLAASGANNTTSDADLQKAAFSYNHSDTYAQSALNTFHYLESKGSGAISGSASGCSSSTAGSTGCNVNSIVDQSEYTQAQLAQIFGDPGTATSHPQMDANLVNVDFLGNSVQVNKIVAPCLEAVAQDIQSRNIDYKITAMGCYRFDSDNGTSNIGLNSYHTYGAACDINPDTNPFDESGAPGPHDMPEGYVEAFNEHGFMWGGSWTQPKDYMHFEFHGIQP